MVSELTGKLISYVAFEIIYVLLVLSVNFTPNIKVKNVKNDRVEDKGYIFMLQVFLH